MELIDSHCHIDVADFDADRREVLQKCRELGVTRMVVPAVLAATWDSLLQLCTQEPGLYPALGLHPVFLDQHQDQDLSHLERYVAQQHPVAIGEIGLDFYIAELDRQRQQHLFDAQLEIARTADLPVILHVRKAHDQVLHSLRRIRVRGGICHAFNGSLQQAHQYLELGFKLGFGGMLTFERSHKLHQLARELPLEALVLETDAPDMTVASHRGERNSPEYLPECLTALATLRDENPAQVAAQTCANVCAVLNL